jgi:hypothetical protein
VRPIGKHLRLILGPLQTYMLVWKEYPCVVYLLYLYHLTEAIVVIRILRRAKYYSPLQV